MSIHTFSQSICSNSGNQQSKQLTNSPFAIAHASNSSQIQRYVINSNATINNNNNNNNSNYMSKNLNANADLTLHSTRPASKTALLIKQRRAILEQLSCHLCKGYLIDAVTIGECMDSFCKSCILKHLNNNNACPKCGTTVHKTNPCSTIRSDKVLQDIVYKLIPGLYDDEMERRRDFYADSFVNSEDSDEDGDSNNSLATSGRISASEKHGLVSHPKPFYRPSDSIDLSIEPFLRGNQSVVYFDTNRYSIITNFTDSQNKDLSSAYTTLDSKQFKSYLRCPAILTAAQLRRFVAIKFNVSSQDQVSLLYLNERLKDEYSLIDVAYIYDWKGVEPMRLLYNIERRVPSTATISEPSPSINQPSKRKHESDSSFRPSNMKRVCIDPEPKYFDTNRNSNFSSTLIRKNDQSTSTSNHPTNLGQKIISHSQLQPLKTYAAIPSSNASFAPILGNVAPGAKVAFVSLASLGYQTASKPSLTTTTASSSYKNVAKVSECLSQASLRSLRSTSSKSPEGHKVSGIAKMNINLNTMTSSLKPNPQSNNGNSVRSNDSQIHSSFTSSNKSTRLIPQSSEQSLNMMNSFSMRQKDNGVVTHVNQRNINFFKDEKNPTNTANRETNSTTNVPTVKPQNSTAASQPRLAISFVTDGGGLAYIRQLDNQPVSGSILPKQTLAPIKDPKPTQTTTNPSVSVSNIRATSIRECESAREHVTADKSSQFHPSSSSASSTSSVDNLQPRPQPKIKPVYKTLVDHTKIKTPTNMRRTSTAKH